MFLIWNKLKNTSEIDFNWKYTEDVQADSTKFKLESIIAL